MKIKKEVRVRVTRNTARVRIAMTAQEHQRVAHFLTVLMAVEVRVATQKRKTKKATKTAQCKGSLKCGPCLFSLVTDSRDMRNLSLAKQASYWYVAHHDRHRSFTAYA